MSNTFASKIFAFAFLVMCGDVVTATLNMNNVCLLLTNNVLIASGDSCSTYYSCSNGIATLKSCSDGLYFDKNSQACVGQAPSYCSVPNKDPCAGRSVGTFVEVSGSCTGYYYCSAEGPLRSDCPDSFVFNPSIQQCVYPISYPCQVTTPGDVTTNLTEINLCSMVQTGIFMGNAFNCAMWQKCTNNNDFITGTCSEGLMYDTDNVMCNFPSAVTCSQLTYDASLDITSASSGGTCTTKGQVKQATACNQYYQCNGINWVLQECVGNLYYDTKSGQCMSRMSAYNNCDRCLGTRNEFVNSFGNNCTGYLYCSHGVEHSAGVCGTGFFFDEALQGCSDENPEYVFCAASSTTETTTPAEGTTGASDATTDKPATEEATTKVTEEATTKVTEETTTEKATTTT